MYSARESFEIFVAETEKVLRHFYLPLRLPPRAAALQTPRISACCVYFFLCVSALKSPLVAALPR
jgi:hypothetical protein